MKDEIERLLNVATETAMLLTEARETLLLQRDALLAACKRIEEWFGNDHTRSCRTMIMDHGKCDCARGQVRDAIAMCEGEVKP